MVVCGEFGAAEGVRDRAALEDALARPDAAFVGEPLYADAFSRAAALMDSIVHERPFAGGNTAVGIMAAAFALERDGYRLEADPADLPRTAFLDVDGIAGWLREHSSQLRS